MQSSPAVTLDCRDGGAWRVMEAGLQGLAAASLVAWLAGPLAGALALLVAVPLGWRRSRPPATPTLAWDGQVWRLDGQPGTACVAVDLGAWLLLRFDPAHGGRRSWLPLSAAAGPWAPMRAALYASHPVEADGMADRPLA